jgi:hypothetical protein
MYVSVEEKDGRHPDNPVEALDSLLAELRLQSPPPVVTRPVAYQCLSVLLRGASLFAQPANANGGFAVNADLLYQVLGSCLVRHGDIVMASVTSRYLHVSVYDVEKAGELIRGAAAMTGCHVMGPCLEASCPLNARKTDARFSCY